MFAVADILRRDMNSVMRSRAVCTGHLVITVPVIVGTALLVYFEYLALGPAFSIYFLMAGIGLGWQWVVFALPVWKRRVIEKGASAEDTDNLARQTGLTSIAESRVGPFALHTAAAGICGFHLGPWLLNRGYLWLRPLAGMNVHIPTGSDHLRNLELVSIVPALVLGYLLSKRFGTTSSKAWIIPTVLLAYKLLTWSEPQTSVLVGNSLNRFEYFFQIERSMPLSPYESGGSQIIRIAEQLSVVGPFYAGVAYSIGAWAGKHELVRKLFEHPAIPLEAESDLPQERAEELQSSAVIQPQEPVQRPN